MLNAVQEALVRQESDLLQNKIRDALLELDEKTLPEALRIGSSLSYVRGGRPNKYDALLPFRRVRISRVKNLSDMSLPKRGQVAHAPSQNEKIKMLSDLLARLEKIAPPTPSDK